MRKINMTITNKGPVVILVSCFLFLFTILFIIPISSFIFSPFSEFANFFRNYFWLIISSFFFFFCFLLYSHLYIFKIDTYVLYVASFNPITRFFKGKKTLEISHSMLNKYKFSKYFGINTVLSLQLKTSSGRKVSKDFIFSFFSEKEKSCAEKILNQIIQENSSKS